MTEPIKCFLTVHLSNCLFSGTSILHESKRDKFLESLSTALRSVQNFQFRGISYTTVRGNHNSLNIILAGTYYNNQAWLDRQSLFKLRAALRKIFVDYKDLVFSQIRIEIVKELGIRFDEA